MTNTEGVVVLMFTFASLVSTNSIGKQCRIYNDTQITCGCAGHEKFMLSEGYNYRNITSFSLSSCAFANLHPISLSEATEIREIIVQNISERLVFDVYITSSEMDVFKLSNVRRIPEITHNSFTNLAKIDLFEIKDATIENFKEEFDEIEVADFIMINVTVKNMDDVNFTKKGRNLRIIDCDFQNVSTSLNFAYFSNVEIVNSRFKLGELGHISIECNIARVENCIFSNVSMNIVAATEISMRTNCADGKSSLRLSSSTIESLNNRLPTEIIYTKNKQQGDSELFLNQNNTVCIAGDCKCPKRNGQKSHKLNFSTLLFEIVSLILIYRSFT